MVCVSLMGTSPSASAMNCYTLLGAGNAISLAWVTLVTADYSGT